MASKNVNTDEPLRRCKNTNCSGEMRVVPSEPGKLLTVAWTWRNSGGEIQAVRGDLPDWCPRCHPRHS